MNPENRGQETIRRQKLQVRRMASTEEGSSSNGPALPGVPAGPVYAPVPLRTAWTVDLGDGHHGTMVHTTSDNSYTVFTPAPAPPAPAPPAPGPQNEDPELLLIRLLYSCAGALAAGETRLVNMGLMMISDYASDDSEETMQRLASSFADALALRMAQPWQGVGLAPQLQHAQEATAARRHFAAMCPFLRISGAVANHAIIDAVAVHPAGRIVHVVDLGGADPDQWLQLLRLFAARSPNQVLRLTIVNEQEQFLSEAVNLLATEAVRLRVSFQFHRVRLHIDRLFSIDALNVRIGEALFVVSTLQLHRLLADEFAEVASPPQGGNGENMKAQQHTMTRADTLLHDLRKLSPRLVVVTEQEADHNNEDFVGRFRNALGYYGALFDALEESTRAGRGSAGEREGVERCLLREEIRDIVARDGALRRERHEKVERWAARMNAAGFAPAAMTQGAEAQAAMLAQELLPGGAYRVSRVNDGCIFIYRNAIPMFCVSTWHAA